MMKSAYGSIPIFTETEPIPDLSLTTGSDADDIGYIQFRQENCQGILI